MKIRLLSILFFTTIHLINAQRTLIPDANFERYLVQNNIDSDNTVNGEVLTADIVNVTVLNLDQKNISDLTGIQNFSNLKVLNAYRNNLTSINVSQNLFLEILSLGDNEITAIDVSRNLRLKEFGIGANQLTTIDVSKNINLEYFSVALNELTTLDVSTLVKLKELKLEVNMISNIDVSNNVDLETLWCFNNNIGALNVQNNTKLTDLHVHLNQLTTLDLTKNTLLTNLRAYNNSLTSLDVKNGNNTIIFNFETGNNPNLFCINVDDVAYSEANWTEIDVNSTFLENCGEGTYIPDVNFEIQIEALGLGNGIERDGYVNTAQISALTTLDIQNKNISDLTGISAFTALVDLNARNNAITNVDLSSNVNLENLDLFTNELTNLDLSHNTKLKELFIATNQLSSIDLSMLPDLRKLWCFKNQFTELKIDKNPLLEVLNCSSNELTAINLYSNLEMLALSVHNNMITDLDLRFNEKLDQVSLSNNNLRSLNIKNENNTAISSFSATQNPNLSCVEVDDASYSTTNWTNVGAGLTFSTDCAPANDDCIHAIPIVYNQTIPGDVNSGNANNNPSCATGNVIADVWFSFIASQSGTFNVSGSGFGGLLKFAVYQTCTSTIAIACGNSISIDNLTVGEKYYLKVWMEATVTGKGLNINTGIFTLIANDSSALSTSNFEEEDTMFSVYPNPTSSILKINTLNNEAIKSVALYNLRGQEMPFNFNEHEHTIDIKDLSKGVYILKIYGNKGTYTKRILKK